MHNDSSADQAPEQQSISKEGLLNLGAEHIGYIKRVTRAQAIQMWGDVAYELPKRPFFCLFDALGVLVSFGRSPGDMVAAAEQKRLYVYTVH